MIEFDKKAAVVGPYNTSRISGAFKKLEDGENVTICFIGGSITQGSLSSRPDTCYAYKVYEWFRDKFQNAKVKYVNAGIGGTTSAFGAARAEQDVLSHKPDIVLVEFSVNDECNDYFLESYEGLIRKLLYSGKDIAVCSLFNFFYQDGKTAERIHSKVARHYGIPAASMHGAIYKDILSGKIEDISLLSPDGLHPNDVGHELVSRVAINLFETLYDEYKRGFEREESELKQIKEAITANSFEKAVRLDNRNFEAVLEGFEVNAAEQKDITDCFKNGWIGYKKNDRIIFELAGDNECTGIAVQYRKTMKRPAPIVAVTVDGMKENTVVIDSQFDETWGDLLDIRQLFLHGKKTSHRMEIEIIDDKEQSAVPFDLVSVIILR